MRAMQDEDYMAQALELAREAARLGEVPIGAVTALLGAPFFLWIFFAGRERQ